MTALPVAGIARSEHFFLEADALDIDTSDLKRLGGFIDRKLRDLVLCAGAIAEANGREIVESHDLPITKGFQDGFTSSAPSAMPSPTRRASPIHERAGLDGGLQRRHRVVAPRDRRRPLPHALSDLQDHHRSSAEKSADGALGPGGAALDLLM
ncbi:DUF1931 family protein [Methylobacterium symbioticum]|uniref:DUF1931 family protein n=1 Tax=Methylobacterium symbioticum TaxID=2584084 RepID=UPI001AEF0C60|nr:DUF1931 family protein [Methylobacterium symbioticum]